MIILTLTPLPLTHFSHVFSVGHSSAHYESVCCHTVTPNPGTYVSTSAAPHYCLLIQPPDCSSIDPSNSLSQP